MRKKYIAIGFTIVFLMMVLTGCETIHKDDGTSEKTLDISPDWIRAVIQVEVYSEYLYYGDKTYNAGAKVRIQVFKEETIELDEETATNSIGEAGTVASAFVLTKWENVTVTATRNMMKPIAEA